MTDSVSTVENKAPTESPVVTPPVASSETPKEVGTLINGNETPSEGSKPPAASWPDDWREKYAGQDEAKMNVLKRYASPQAALDALFAARSKIQSGGVKTSLPESPTPEELSAYRKEHGIPEKPEEYDTNIDGLVFGEDDKPIVDAFLHKMHAANATPAQVKAGLEAYHAAQAQVQEARYDQDLQFKQASVDQVREEWGRDYKLNLNLMKSMFETHGSPEIMDLLINGRAADGNVIGNHPAILRTLVNLARQINPVATVTSGGNAQSIDDELNKLQGMMGDHSSEYWKGPNAEKNQSRFRQLIEAKEKLK